ncbi:unnamed protein product [Boreogadus saida]
MSPSYEPSLPRLPFPPYRGAGGLKLRSPDPAGSTRPPRGMIAISLIIVGISSPPPLPQPIRVCLGYGPPPGSIRDAVPQALLLGQRPGSLQRETDSERRRMKRGHRALRLRCGSTSELGGENPRQDPHAQLVSTDGARLSHPVLSPPLGQQESRGGGRGAHLSGGTDVTCSARHMLGVSERVS